MDFKGKKVIIMGLGLHGGGVGVAKWILLQGAKVVITDLKTKEQLQSSIKELEVFIKTSKVKINPPEYVLGRHREEDFKRADLIIRNPGVPKESKFLKFARENKIPIATDMTLFFNLCPAPIIGITGTKGKSTVATLVGEIFKLVDKRTLLAGNIRKSPLSELNKIKSNTPIILELSSWQLEDLVKDKLNPHIAVITNIYQDHLNRHQGMKDYIKTKKIIFAYQKQDDFTILNYDNEITRKLGKEVLAQRYWFSKNNLKEENGVFMIKNKIVFRQAGKETVVCSLKDIKILGEHNLENILAGVAVASVGGVKPSVIRQAIRGFKGVPGRLELVRVWQGIKFYNDTTATAPDATIKALQTLRENKKKIILIAGGADKNLDFKELVKKINDVCKAVVFLPGTATDKIVKQYLVFSIQYSLVKSMKEAVDKALTLAKKGDIILLSPGCASFGLFVNEFDRGAQFDKIVKSL